MKLLRKIRARFRKQKLDTEMAEEMRLHLELQTEQNIARGMKPDEARYAAQRQFGGVEQIKEHCRDQRGWVGAEQFVQDVRFAARALRRDSGFTVVAALTLAFGIGVNTSMFTALRALLIRNLPYPDSGSLVQVFHSSPHSQRWPHAPANFLDVQSRNTVFECMAAANVKPFNLSEPGQPAEQVHGLQVSAELFPLLGIEPELGRIFTSAEDHPGQNNVVILSHGFWLRRFAGDPQILGRRLRLDGESVTVVGVMPARFRDVMLFGFVDVWRPIAFTDGQRQDRVGNYLKAVARLKHGVSLAQAQAEMDVVAQKLAREFPANNSTDGVRLVPLAESSAPPEGRRIIWLIITLASFVLLIACANLANLQFARTARRATELAIRGALGAARGRLLRLLLTESLLVAVLGGGLGLLVAVWSNDFLSRQIVVDGESVLTLPLSPGELGFALVLSTLSGVVFGLIPAWLASRTDVNAALKQGSRGATGSRSQNRLQHLLIVVEVALALTLLAGAGLAVRGLQRFSFQDPGWRVEGLTLAHLSLPAGKYPSDESRRTFVDRLQEKFASLPGVERVAIAEALPIGEFNISGDFTIAGQAAVSSGQKPLRFVDEVTPGYFETVGMRLLIGRDFNATDTGGRPAVVIINETMARTFWPNKSPIGQHVDDQEIIGVVNDVRFPADPGEPQTRFQTYRPFAQDTKNNLVVVVRGDVTVATLRRTVAEIDPDQPVNEPGSANAAVDRILSNFAVGGKVVSAFSVLGLLLASLGLYGVIAGFVAQRTKEIGVRIALGAQLRDVLWLVVGKGLKLTLCGGAIGLIGALGVARLLASVAPGLGAGDPATICVATVVLTAVATLACWLPARRAAKVDPMVALRCE